MIYSYGTANILRAFLLFALILKTVTGFPVPTIDPQQKSAALNNIRCSLKHIRCLNKGRLPHYDGRCFDPLERGPCSPGEWFTLDTNTTSGEYPAIQCSPRPCDPGQVFLEGSCLSYAEARTRLCGGAPIHLDPAGSPRCGEQPIWREVLAEHVMCARRARRAKPYTEIVPITSTTTVSDITLQTAVGIDDFSCAVTNEGKCAPKVEVVTQATVFELDK